MQIEEMMENKNVLMIPVYSSRSYEDGMYDLMSDGNASKYLMKIIKSNAKSIDIFYPKNSTNVLEIISISNKYSKCRVLWIPVKYGENAKETRNMGQTFLSYINNKYDLVITEINTLAFNVYLTGGNEYCNKDNLLYWVGTHNADGSRWDSDGVGQGNINKMIASEIQTACLMPAQHEYLQGKSFNDKYTYYPEYFDKKDIFLPFRISDKAYQMRKIKEIIYNLLDDNINNFVVLYTDPNDSHLFDNEDEDIFIKVSKNKYVYQAILKGKPIIIYLDDLVHNSHSNIFEFIYYGCKIIMYKNVEICYNENIIFIEKEDEIEKILTTILKEENNEQF